MFGDVRSFLGDQINVSQSHVLNLRLRGKKSDQRRRELLDHVVDKFCVLAHHLHVFHQDLDRREDNSSVGMGRPWSDPLADGLSLPVILGVVAGQRVEDEDLTLLRALVQGSQELVDGCGDHLNQGVPRAAALVDL